MAEAVRARNARLGPFQTGTGDEDAAGTEHWMQIAVRLFDARQDALAVKKDVKGKAAAVAKKKVAECFAGEGAALARAGASKKHTRKRKAAAAEEDEEDMQPLCPGADDPSGGGGSGRRSGGLGQIAQSMDRFVISRDAVAASADKERELKMAQIALDEKKLALEARKVELAAEKEAREELKSTSCYIDESVARGPFGRDTGRQDDSER